MPEIEASQRTAAKVAGLAYLIPVAFVLVANFVLRADLFVSGDAAESVRRIAAAEARFRLSIAFDLVYCSGVVVLLAALYVVLGPVNRILALVAAALKLVYAVTAMLMALDFRSVVRLVSDPRYLQALGAGPLQGLVKLHYASTADDYYVGLVFWALSSTVLGWLWVKSRYVPAALAWFGLVSSAWCAFCAFAYIVTPAFTHVVNLWVFDTPMALFDIALSFSLLFRGLARPHGS